MRVIDINTLIGYGKRNYAKMKQLSGDLEWEYCHVAFSDLKGKELTQEAVDRLCLQLEAYLAIWGMFRNSFLRDYCHKVHEAAIRELYDSKWEELWDIDYLNMDVEKAGLIEELSKKLSKIYKPYLKPGATKLTDTLVTKILLGTLACIPAFDQYFVSAMKICNGKAAFDETSIMELAELYVSYSDEFCALKAFCGAAHDYPSAKLIDMCFIEYGQVVDAVREKARGVLSECNSDFNARTTVGRKMLALLTLYAIHRKEPSVVSAILTEFADVYAEDRTFYDERSEKIWKYVKEGRLTEDNEKNELQA